MVAKAREKGVCLGVDMNHRFTPAARLAKQWLDEGKLGRLLFVNMSMWIMNPQESSPYYHIKALHPHTVDVMRYFAAILKRCNALACRRRDAVSGQPALSICASRMAWWEH